MTNDPVYWAANVAGLDDANLLRFLEAVEQRRAKYQVALDAATQEAKRRGLIVEESAQ
jgi:hypothetical protein